MPSAAAKPQQAVTMVTFSGDFNDDTTSGSLKSACLQGYFTAAKCEVGYAASQPRGKYQSLAQIEGLQVGKGK